MAYINERREYTVYGCQCQLTYHTIRTFSHLINPSLRAKLFFFLSPNDLINLLAGDCSHAVESNRRRAFHRCKLLVLHLLPPRPRFDRIDINIISAN